MAYRLIDHYYSCWQPKPEYRKIPIELDLELRSDGTLVSEPLVLSNQNHASPAVEEFLATRAQAVVRAIKSCPPVPGLEVAGVARGEVISFTIEFID